MPKRSTIANLKILNEWADGASQRDIGEKWGHPGKNGGKALVDPDTRSRIASHVGKQILRSVAKDRVAIQKFIANDDGFRSATALEKLYNLMQTSKNENIQLRAADITLETTGDKKINVNMEGKFALADFVLDMRDVPEAPTQ